MNLNELDLENMGTWPTAAKATLISILCLLVLFFFYLFDFKPLRQQINQAQIQQSELKTTFQVKYSQAVTYPAYIEQVHSLNTQIKQVIAQLPAQIDVPELIADISKIGNQSGLTFNFIKPQSTIKYMHYTALPIDISINGTYGQLTEFITKLSQLSRIIIVDEFSITHANTETGNKTSEETPPAINQLLIMDLTATTYQKNNPKKTSLGTPPKEP